MGDVDGRLSHRVTRSREARRERDHVGEKVAVGDTDRQRVRGAVREAADRQPTGVNGVAVERIRESLVDDVDICPERSPDDVPGRTPTLRCQQKQTRFLGGRQQRIDTAAGVTAGAVQQQGQGRRHFGTIVGRHKQQGLTAGPEGQRE
jgi:hypothetical protein